MTRKKKVYEPSLSTLLESLAVQSAIARAQAVLNDPEAALRQRLEAQITLEHFRRE